MFITCRFPKKKRNFLKFWTISSSFFMWEEQYLTHAHSTVVFISIAAGLALTIDHSSFISNEMSLIEKVI